jgi:ribulose-5-phosphate 4-epimerase/fuculose-1-phosphate aldolase
MLTQDICNFHNAHSVYTSHNGIVFSSSEGASIAHALGPTNKGVILQNHGLLTVGSTVDEAGFLFGLMDRGCEIQLKAEAAAANGLEKKIIGEEEAAFNFRWASEKHALYREMQPDVEFEMEMAGEGVLEKGVELQIVDHGKV